LYPIFEYLNIEYFLILFVQDTELLLTSNGTGDICILVNMRGCGYLQAIAC